MQEESNFLSVLTSALVIMNDSNLLMFGSDKTFDRFLHDTLKQEGFSLTYISDVEQGMKQAFNETYDIIILELHLTECHGFKVLTSLREQINIPILILTSSQDDIDRILSLELGADAYLSKPCSSQELIAHLNSLKRRISSPSKHGFYQFANITMDCSKRTITLSGSALELTNTEFNILEILIKSPQQAFSKEELTKYALGRKYTSYDRSIDVHMSHLRHKLGNNPSGHAWIKTIRGFGYLFDYI